MHDSSIPFADRAGRCAAACFVAAAALHLPPHAIAAPALAMQRTPGQAVESAHEDIAPQQDASPRLADPEAYRMHAVMDKLCAAFAVKLEPEQGDQPIDLLPKGTTEVTLINPGFMFTHSKGKAPGDEASVHKIKRDQPIKIKQDGDSPGDCDPIKGWHADGCAGLETTTHLHTPADGATGYVLAHGTEHRLEQTLQGKLKPNTRYIFMVELYAHKNYKAPLPEDLILRLVDGNNKHLDAVHADYDIASTDPDTGFAVLLITLTTSADQTPGDLCIHLGINAKGNFRANYDNARLWQRAVEP